MASVNRVALVSLHFAEYIVNLAVALAEKKQVLLILYQDNVVNELGPDWQNKLNVPNLESVVLTRPKSPLSIFKNMRLLLGAMKKFTPDVVHYQDDPRDELTLSLPFLTHIPSVLTIHDPKRHTGRDAEFTRLTVYRMYIRRIADIAISHGDLMVAEIIEMYPRFKNKVFSIPHGPLGVGFNGTKSIKPDGLRLLFFGRIHVYKGLVFFVESVIALRNKGYPVVGVVAGTGTDLEPHRQRMLDNGGFEIIERYIAAEEIPSLFMDSLITVLPYTDGTQSGVAAMALGFGRPVVASAVGSIPELVRDGKNGLLVPPCNTDKLTQALEAIITDDILWKKLADGALALKNGELSWSAIADKTILAYEAATQLK